LSPKIPFALYFFTPFVAGLMILIAYCHQQIKKKLNNQNHHQVGWLCGLCGGGVKEECKRGMFGDNAICVHIPALYRL
jgi:hypothetical protein